VSTLSGGESLFASDRESAERYPWNGPAEGHDWIPDSMCVAASELYGKIVDGMPRDERDMLLRVYVKWRDLGRPLIQPSGKPPAIWMLGQEDDPVARRMLAELAEARTAAQGDLSGPKRPPVTPTPAPKAPAEPDGKAEAAASRWGRQFGIRHNPLRRSQTAVGVAERAARRRERQADLDRKAAAE
jgi:hypothetical protein